ncbi:MAG: hypothetical protein HY909_05440 [Deltaproteobacteria bacterium]|nr:hypothetical protein [Deltaproteobacteria bacterium]
MAPRASAVVLLGALGCSSTPITEEPDGSAPDVSVDVRADSALPPPPDTPPPDAPPTVDTTPLADGGCEPPLLRCGALCAEVFRDPRNCGRCGNVCQPGETCVANTCAVENPRRRVMPGIPCAANADCGAEGVCQLAAAGWPMGYCTYSCAATGDCGATGVCVASNLGRLCIRTCMTRGDCRAGYVCSPVPGSMVSLCVPSCAANPALSCGSYRCDAASERCATACRTSMECSAGSACTGGRCVCSGSTACGAGRACNVATTTCQCIDDASCGAGARCDRPTGRCVAR